MAVSYRVLELPLSDPACQDQITAIWDRVLMSTPWVSSRQKLDLGYLDNPAGSGVALAIVAGEDAQPCGVQCVHRRVFSYRGQILQGGGLADYAVDAQHRTLGPALMLAKRCAAVAAERFDLAYGYPNMKAAPVFGRAGLKKIGQLRRFVKLLSTESYLSRALPSWLVPALAPVADVAVWAADAVRAVRLQASLRCLPVGWDNAEFDAIWAARTQDLLLSDRSGSTLRWRYQREGRGSWQVCLVRDRGHQPVGFVVWQMKDGRALVSDFFCSDPRGLTASLLVAFSRLARSHGARSVEVNFAGSESVMAGIRQAGFVPREDGHAVFVAPSRRLGELNAEDWYLTSFDDDTD